MRQMLVRFVLLFAVAGEASLVGPAVEMVTASPAAGCSILGIGTAAAVTDLSSGTLKITPASCEGFAQATSHIGLMSLTVR